MKRLLVIAFLFPFLAGLSLTQAQEQSQQGPDCPKDYYCVPYQGVVVEIDPAQGPAQYIVTEKHCDTTYNLSGTWQDCPFVKIAGFFQQADGYFVKDERTVERKGVFADAEVEDVFALTKATANAN